MKLVVTGHDANGRSIFTHAGAPPREAGPGSYELWTTKGPISMPDRANANGPASIGYFPKEGETAFKIVTVPGLAAQAASPGAAHAIPDDLKAHFDPDDPGMHTTDTIDYVLIVSGSADLELDDGRKEAVRAGDCVVQRGTRHAWRVTSQEPMVLCAVLIGARRVR